MQVTYWLQLCGHDKYPCNFFLLIQQSQGIFTYPDWILHIHTSCKFLRPVLCSDSSCSVTLNGFGDSSCYQCTLKEIREQVPQILHLKFLLLQVSYKKLCRQCGPKMLCQLFLCLTLLPQAFSTYTVCVYVIAFE